MAVMEKAIATHSSTLAWKTPWMEETEWLHFHFSLLCIGEGNGNPLQCSCLENPRDSRACWAAVYGVAESQTWLKWLSRSSRVFSNESALCIGWPKHWSFSNIEYSGLIFFRIDWFDLLAVQGTLKSLLQHNTLKASITGQSAFFMV